ncbi:hypothetical protein ACFWSF_06655 [Streptomyces sp. NPDC058611]|uniref:hypothetical protein n=1 Tax=unclassified Streptomyces TaxID=2593676 RepID=UPI00365208FC
MDSTEFRLPDHYVRMADLLPLIPDNDWIWSVLEAHGIWSVPAGDRTSGIPGDLSAEAFEDLVQASPTGFVLGWSELRAFAADLEQNHWLTVVAVRSADDLVGAELRAEDYSRCLVLLEAFDSGSWTVAARPGATGHHDIVAAARARYGGQEAARGPSGGPPRASGGRTDGPDDGRR